MDWLEGIVVLLVVGMIGAAIADIPLWVPFLIVGIVIVLLLFFGKKG